MPEEASSRFKVSPQYKEYVIAPMKTSPAETGGTNGLAKTQEVPAAQERQSAETVHTALSAQPGAASQ